MDQVTVLIDGKQVSVDKGTSLLAAARRARIDVPALCWHEALEPYGACRLCLVEVTRGGRSRMTTSCNYPVLRSGETVSTNSERVAAARRLIMELLLARCPSSKPVREMASRLGVEKSRFPTLRPAAAAGREEAFADCILCGLCVRACRESIGASAISFAHRGASRMVSAPFFVSADACIGCGACVSVCPTGLITMEDSPEGVRRLPYFNTSVQLSRCESCGAPIAPEPQLAKLLPKAASVEKLIRLCPACRRRTAGAAMSMKGTERR